MLAVHQVQVLGLGVVRLEILIADRPRGRDAAVMADLAEVLRPQAEQGRAVELRVSADVVVDLRRELVAVAVQPELRRTVLALHEDRGGVPVVPLARQVVTTFEQQDLLAGRRQPVSERASTGPGADDDHVVAAIVWHIGIL